MKKLHQNVKKVIYFNDECFGLCKNFNNFSSLCLNENGSGLATTWNVFTVCKKKVLIISNKLLNSLLQFSLSAYSDFKKIKYSIYL